MIRSRPAIALIIFAVASLAAGCGAKESMPLVRECVLPSDQSGTLLGKWAKLPVPIEIHEGDFDSSSVTAIGRAENPGIFFSPGTHGYNPLDYETSSVMTPSSPFPISADTGVPGTLFTEGNF